MDGRHPIGQEPALRYPSRRHGQRVVERLPRQSSNNGARPEYTCNQFPCQQMENRRSLTCVQDPIVVSQGFRKPLLYPLSYEGDGCQGTGLRVPGFTWASRPGHFRHGAGSGAHGAHTGPAVRRGAEPGTRLSPAVTRPPRRAHAHTRSTRSPLQLPAIRSPIPDPRSPIPGHRELRARGRRIGQAEAMVRVDRQVLVVDQDLARLQVHRFDVEGRTDDGEGFPYTIWVL